MEKRVADLREAFAQELKSVKSAVDAQALKVKFLGKKGPVQALMAHLREVPAERRPEVGQSINALKLELETLVDEAFKGLQEAELLSEIEREGVDMTLPGRRRTLGRGHPISEVLEECIEILRSMGFSTQLGPDIDTDYYNYEALNFPADHPARDMQDTFYITDNLLLRSHTSNTQIRVMEKHAPPIRIIAPGSAFRNETISARSHVFFHQIEGLMIDKGVSFADLMSTMKEFWSKLFKRDVETLFRPSYFPFVEPGLEVDIRCSACEGSGCSLCKKTGWLEVAGAGMVHPNVLRNGGIDPEVYSGYAWGIGMERLAMLRLGIQDIRLFFENDQRFLSQF